MDAQFPMSVFDLFKRNRIIKIASRFGVDCYDGRVGKIGAAVFNRFIKSVSLLTRIVEHRFGKVLRQTKFPNHHQRIDAGLPTITQNFNDYTFADGIGGRKVDHFDDDLVTDLAIFRRRVAHHNAGLKRAAVDDYVPIIATDVVTANELMCFALDDFDDTSGNTVVLGTLFTTSPRIRPPPRYANQHRIQMGRVERFGFGDKDVFGPISCRRILRRHESESTRCLSKRPDDFIGLRFLWTFGFSRFPVCRPNLRLARIF